MDKEPQLRKQLYQKAAKNKIPISGAFELTSRCNMNCKMCHIHMSNEEISKRGREFNADEWIEMGKICKDAGTLFLLLTGGEPFLRSDFQCIYTELSKMGFVITINSNGTMITDSTVEWLKQTPPSKINITLYGANNETYRRLCGNNKGFEQTAHAIDLLQKSGINIGINASFTPYNIEDMEGIYAFAKKRGIKVKEAVYMIPPVRNEKEAFWDKHVRLRPEQAGKALFYAKRYQMSEENFDFFTKLVNHGLYFSGNEEKCEYMTNEHMGCMAGRCSFWITWDGRMTPCGMMNQPEAWPFEAGFQQSWKFICRKTEKILLPAECRNCKKRFACMVCGAVTIAEGYGDSTKKPEYMCELMDSYLKCCAEREEQRSVQ